MNNTKKIICSVLAVIGVITGGSSVYSEAPVTSSLQPDAVAIGTVEIGDLIVGELIVSPNALKVIGNAEGCRRSPYVCPAGLETDGIGNTHNVTNEIKTDDQIAVDWTRNIIDAQNCLASSADVSLMSQGQIDAFTSFIFNTGCTRFKHNRDGSETRIYHKIKQGWFVGACNELKYWVYAGGKKLAGLVSRREQEREMCFAN
ncbi:lysozyme [Vibrio parahaemolyticus]|uniref:lysozyme n=1 Tax=Vibrio parahaemolyticus TaxID=670 RepID=UPI00111E26A5|nr:lysozyme [Vibrio parahaemolyticus]TOP74114.1 lysozyme [Vibrio parahaemolyticus]